VKEEEISRNPRKSTGYAGILTGNVQTTPRKQRRTAGEAKMNVEHAKG